jgi:Threonine dehydrogenase and related Zn-dependent dehydrogenases
MRALRLTNNGLAVADIAVPAQNGETLVRVTKSGICNTDLEIVRGYAEFHGTIGHEFVGVVEFSTEQPDLTGKRVVGEINVGCGYCDLCLAGDARHCFDRTVLGIKNRDGAHAEFLTLPARNLLIMPDNVSDNEAVFAEPLAAALGISEQVELRPETKVAVIGDGKLGILCSICAAARSQNVSLIGKHRSKLSIAEKQGVEGILLENVNETFNKTFDVVIEASGSDSGFALAIDLVRPRGKIVLKSTFQGKPVWEAWRVVVDEITIIGSRCGKMAPALDLLDKGIVNVEDMIDEEFSLANGIAAIKRAGQKGALKVLLKP